ncbi:hypothetical protein [Ligilactobacillus salivarius]|uniref:Uncharacterized protein n=1 Tax=Ligilactobacillus salivarius TaxID=1624 RepID=A0A089QCM9_9LACO|nr:hypothetical protein [Ligilactobacillus salivarius]AIR10495.1 Hypothetical protein LSJ_0812c [Ligilactobacillus salivarius]
MESVIPKILGIFISLGIAYLIFKWNKKNKQSKIYYTIACMFLIGGLYMPFAKTVSPEQEAAESSKAESSSTSEVSKNVQKHSEKSSENSDNTNTRNELDTAVNFINNKSNSMKASIAEDNKAIILTVDDSVSNVALNANKSEENQDNWIKFTGEINNLTKNMLVGKYNVKVPFIVESTDGTKLMESKHGFTVYDIMDHEQ